MSAKRSTSSPGRHSLMADVLRLIAEPGSSCVNSRKKSEVPRFYKNGKVTNHNYCDVCSGGGEIVCCDKCPKSYHIKCHSPSINKLPDGEWLCRDCAYIENKEINPDDATNDAFDFKKFLKKKIDSLPSYYLNEEEFLSEVSIHRKHNVKLSTRKQLDKTKMIRKNDRCYVCKRGVLRGRLMQCSYCHKLYHLNCLDPPIRDWDHSMKFQCPLHTKFFELVYPTIFTADCGVRSDAITIKRQRCELVSLPVNTFFSIPSHIDAMYKEPEETIPTTEKSSLNILCDVASIALESINSNHDNTSSDNNVSNDVSAKFLAHQHINKFPKKKYLLPKQPIASLSCLSTPNSIPINKNSFTIGKHCNNDLCLLQYGNCEYLSDQHVTITFDSKLGDFLVKNHSRYGIIVDNVSYFGSHRPKEVSNRELKVISSQYKKYINKRRRTIQNCKMLHIFKDTECENTIIKYADRRRKFDCRLMFKHYSNMFKNVKHTYPKVQCKCSKRVVPKDGYHGQAILRNKSIMLIGCMKFIFTCDTEGVPKIYPKKVPKVCAAKVSKVNKKNMSVVFGEEVLNASTTEIPEIYVVNESPKISADEHCNTCVEEVSEVHDKVPTVYINEEFIEELYRERVSKLLELSQNGMQRSCLSEITASFTSLNNRCDSMETPNLLKVITYLDNNSDCEFSDSHMEIDEFVPNDISLDKDHNSIQTSNNDDNLNFDERNNLNLDNVNGQSLNEDVDPTLNISGDPTLNDVHVSSTTDMESLERHRIDLENGVQCFAIDDLVQEVYESFSDGCEVVEEEVMFELGYNDSAERVSNIQSWIEEIDVDEYGSSTYLQSQLQANNNAHGSYKTEHMYCARSPTQVSSPIVISDDDD